MMDAASALNVQSPTMRVGWRVTPLRLAAMLVLLALGVRLIAIGARPLWLDEAYSAWFSRRGWHELWTVVPTYEPHPPFYYSLLKLWRGLFGGHPVALRGFSIMLGVLTVPVVMAAAAEQERQQPIGRPLLRAGIAGFLAACSPMLVLLDQEARPYPLLIFAYAVAILGLLRLMREFEGGPGRWSSWLILGAGAELALWAHGLGALYALCLAAALAPAWLQRPFDQARLVRGAVTAAATALLYLPCLVMMVSRVGDWGTGWLNWKLEKLLQLIGLYAVPYEALTIGSAVTALAMLLLIKRALQSGFAGRGWNSERAILLLWWGPPLLAALVSALFMPVFIPRTLAATLVPAYLAIAAALARTGSPRERLGLAAALCIPLAVTAVQVAARPSTERWDEVSAFLARQVGPSDEVWLYPNDSALPLRAANPWIADHARGIPENYPAVGFKGPIRAGSPAVVSLTPAQAERTAADPGIRNVPTIWLVTRQSMLFDPDADLPSALARVRRPGKIQEWGYVSAQPFTARHSTSGQH
jgi:hypothetical protein